MNHVRLDNDYHTDCSVLSSESQADRVDIPQLKNIWETQYLIGVDTDNETFAQPHQDDQQEDAHGEENTP